MRCFGNARKMVAVQVKFYGDFFYFTADSLALGQSFQLSLRLPFNYSNMPVSQSDSQSANQVNQPPPGICARAEHEN